MSTTTITERQERCVQVLCSKLGRPAPDGLGGLSLKEASSVIEKLGNELDGFVSAHKVQGASKRAVTGLSSRDSQIRLGLAAKLVHQQWSTMDKKALGDKGKFKSDVIELYGLLNEVEAELASASVGGGA